METRKYQSEKPSDSDQFGGQGHMKVAEAIAKVLLKDNSQHIIGIEGNLGAGKSSVINLLEQKIIGDGFHVVTFDADQYHQSLKPALIKTIEIELKKLLIKKDKRNLSKLEKAVETALGKRLEYTKNTNSNISFSALLFVFSLAVSVLQLKPSLNFLFDLMKDLPTIDKSSGLLSLGLFFLPGFIFVFMKFFGVKTRLGDLIKRNTLDKISETIDVTRDVGAMELKEAFKTFSEVIPSNNTLLLVIDNIDRLSPDIAREVWSDIETLTSLSNERFRILLPYSEKHLARALEKSTVDESQSGREFISKRLPVSFSAPPIVTTGWRKQFEVYWEETLYDITGQDGVKDLIEIWSDTITPRYLKSIVNRIGAKIDSCPESNDELSGASCAAYLMVVKDCNLNINEFLAEQTYESTESQLNSLQRKIVATHKILRKYDGQKDNWAKQVAALHFQTTFDIAQSELIIEPIRTAFNSFDVEKIAELSYLFGFEVFFKKQLNKTDVADLIKISALLTDDERGLEILQDYLDDINHELKDSLYENTDFDEDLVDDYKKLKEKGINIDLKIPNSLQEQAVNDIDKDIRVLKRFRVNGNSEDIRDSVRALASKLEIKIKECYEYCCITDNIPDFIKKPDSDLVVNGLFPIEEELEKWNVREIIRGLSTKYLIASACRRQNLINDTKTIFPLILEKVRIGDFQDVASEDLLVHVDFEDKKSLVNLLPFKGGWHKSGEDNISQLLVDSLMEMSKTKLIDESTMLSHIALCAAAFVKKNKPTDNINIKQLNGQSSVQLSSTWLASQLEIYPKVTKYITDYLSTCGFSDIIIWCKNDEVGKYLISSLDELVSSQRVNSLNVMPILKNDYLFVKQNVSGLTTKEILAWIDRWEKYFKEASTWLEWGEELIDDILEFQPDCLLTSLIKCFDDSNVKKEEWLERMENNHPTIRKIACYLADKGDVLVYQDSLLSALKEIPVQQSDYDFTLVDSLTKLIDKRKIRGMNTSLKASLLKNDTSLEKRYRTIKYFGSRFNMPKITTVNLQMEVINLIDNAISQKNETVKRWLLDQSTWNIFKWSEENLNGLSVILESASDLKEEKLTTDVRMRLEELSVNEEPPVDVV